MNSLQDFENNFTPEHFLLMVVMFLQHQGLYLISEVVSSFVSWLWGFLVVVFFWFVGVCFVLFL